MTLPAGQISLSEVNVELGYSATALITMNDTAVRNLAGVPSGQISMSNLQGKSNNPYFILYGGTQGSTVQTGSFQNSGIVALQNGACMTMTYNASYLESNLITIFNNDGTLASAYSYANQSMFLADIGNFNASNPAIKFLLGGNYVNYQNYNSLGTWVYTTAKTGATYNSGNRSSFARNSSGVTATASSDYVSKQDVPVLALFDSSGNLISFRRTVMSGQVLPTTRQCVSVRSDGEFLWYSGSQSNSTSSTVWGVLSSSTGTISSGISYGNGTNITVSGMNSSMIDSNNNVYCIGSDGSYNGFIVIKMNSSGQPTRILRWSPPGTGYSLVNAATATGAIYGNYLYTCYGGYNTNEGGLLGKGYFYVVALNLSDLSVAWCKSFTSDWGTGNYQYTGPYGGGPTQSSAISASQYGVWVQWVAGSTGASLRYPYLMKLPLDGSLANQTVSIGGKSITIGSATGTSSFVTPPPNTSAWTQTYNTYSNAGSGTNSTFTSRSTPTISKTNM